MTPEVKNSISYRLLSQILTAYPLKQVRGNTNTAGVEILTDKYARNWWIKQFPFFPSLIPSSSLPSQFSIQNKEKLTAPEIRISY